MKTKFASVLVVFAILMLPLFHIVLLQFAYTADKNAPAHSDLLDINTATAEQ
jgi:DNA uptake protein ComE-like DNA-binding protein